MNLTLVSWIGTFCSFAGIILNIYKIIWCWPLWLIGNCFWIYWSYKKEAHAQTILWITYQFTNLLGWYQWMK